MPARSSFVGAGHRCYCSSLQASGSAMHTNANYDASDFVFKENDRAICRKKIADKKPSCLKKPYFNFKKFGFAFECENYIDSLEDCQQAAKQANLQFNGVVNWSSSPSGCLKSIANLIYFNSNTNNVVGDGWLMGCVMRKVSERHKTQQL